MNKYSDSLNAIYALSDYTGGSVAVAAFTDADDFDLQHVHRWLHYNGSGTITDLANPLNTVSLSDPTDGNPGVYDLDSISWLYYGAYYHIDGPDWVAEDWEA
jgi:hypothetical protein